MAPDPVAPLPSMAVFMPVFRRKEFLLAALDSIRAGDPRPVDAEIIVVATVVDPELRGACEARGARWIQVPEASLGENLLTAFDASHAEIFAMLDDDDLFEPGRLSHVRELFARDRSLLYYHNGFTVVDAEDRPIGRSERPLRAIRIEPPSRKRGIAGLAGSDPDLNDSSIAVRRSVIESCRTALVGMATVDSLLFYTALTMEGSLLIDPERWTRYRVHPQNVTRGASRTETEMLGRLHSWAVRSQPHYERIRAFLSPRADRTVKRELLALVRVNAFYRALRDPTPDRAGMFFAIVRLLPMWGTFLVRSNRRAVAGGLLYLFSPRFAQMLYLRGVADRHPGSIDLRGPPRATGTG